ncbi:MAG: hypothetical protein Q3988_02605 [Gemella sp.]|nr:hypothetical protein [Gemella sp.]
MKSLKNAFLFFSLGVAAYATYKKVNSVQKEEGFITDCKKQILDRGYEIKDSWCFNLPENNYLEFTFTDYKGKDYTVVYSKTESKITSFIEV